MNPYEDIPRADLEKLIMTNLIWDLVEHSEAADMMVRMDMVPPSPDGAVVACEASHKRMDVVKRLDSDLTYMSRIITTIVLDAILGDAAKEIGEEIVEQLRTQYTAFLEAGSKVIIANFFAAGMLDYKRKDAKT